MPNFYRTSLNERLLQQQQILPSCRYLKVEGIWRAISAAISFVGWYRHSFRGYKLKYLSIWCPDIWSFTCEGLGAYPIWIKNTLFFPTLDRSASYLDQNNQLISSIHFFSLLKWAQDFPFSVQQVKQLVKHNLQ